MHAAHKSGATKRKEHQIREKRKKDEESKIPKLDTYFIKKPGGDGNGKVAAESTSISPSDESSSTSTCTSTATSSKSELTKSILSPAKVDQESDKVFTVFIDEKAKQDVDTIGTDPGSPAILKEKELSHDIGLWGDSLSEEMKTYWIAVGFEKIQHLDHDFKKSGVVHGKEGYRRYCQTSFFTRVHPLTGERISRSWLCYSPLNGKLYCGPCKLLSKTRSAFTFGFNDWKHGEEKISAHENSHQHRDCMVAVCTRKAVGGCVDKKLILQFESERMYWRKLLERIVTVIIFLCERGLPLRGKNEIVGSKSNGNFLGILEVLASYDAFLSEHIKKYANKGKGHTSYLSSTTCEELITLMGDKLLDTIIEELKASKFYSISVDSTPDVSLSDQLTFIVRYVQPQGPVERFLGFLPMIGHTGQSIADMILSFLEKHGIDINNCRGQSYDNASNMSGKYVGVQTVIRQHCPYATFIPCAAHSLNLVGKSASESCPLVVRFFELVNNVYTFFSASTYRWRQLCEALNPLQLSLVKRLSDTRWSAMYEAVHALYKGFTPICTTLETLSSDMEQKADCRNQAQSILKKLGELESAILVVFWNTILECFHKTSLSLQDPTVCLNVMVSLLESLADFVQTQRTMFDHYESQGIEVCGHDKYKSEQKRVFIRNRRYDEGSAEETVLPPRDKFRTEVFLVVVDKMTIALQQRLEAYKEVNIKFGFLSNIINMALVPLSDSEVSAIKHSAANLVSSYPDDLEPSLESELVQISSLFASSSDLQASTCPKQSKSAELRLYQFLHEHSLVQTFPNTEIALRIYLSMMVSNSGGERSFSKLKLIKNEQRNSMGQERLSHLSIMNIESELLRTLDFSDITDDFSRQKSRKKSLK